MPRPPSSADDASVPPDDAPDRARDLDAGGGPDAELDTLQSLLDAVPPPLEPLDASALDGFLCGVILQPRAVPPARWLARAVDPDASGLPAGWDPAPLQAAIGRRHAALQRAIDARAWFDPWIYAPDPGGADDAERDDAGAASPSDSVLPWVAGFALALELFPELSAIDDPALVEPLALLFLHFDPDDLEDADALLAVIETLEPPADLAEAVQDLVRALMLIADVTRPRARAAPPRPPRGPAPGRRRR
jgi:uncharacterized protein